MKKSLATILSAVMILSLAACGGNSTAPAATTAAPATEAPKAEAAEAAAAETEAPAAEASDEGPIKIGYVGDLTGGTALWGTAGQYGAELAAKDINEAGGIMGREVVIVPMDGKGDPSDSVSALKKLIDDEHVVASIGTNFSSCNIPMASVADEKKVPIIATAASNELVTVDENGKLHPYSFRLCFIDPYIGEVIGSYAAGTLGYKTAALFTVAGNTNSESVGAIIKDVFTSKGGEIVIEEQCQEADMDYRAQLAKIGAKNPDVIFVLMNDYAKLATFAKQARELGIESMLMGHDGWDSAQLAGEAGGALEGCLYISRIGFNTPEAAAFGDRVTELYKMESREAECLFTRDGVYWIKDAIERAGSADPTAIRDALESTEKFEGLIGTLVEDPATHNPAMACALFECHGDAFEYKGIVEAE